MDALAPITIHCLDVDKLDPGCIAGLTKLVSDNEQAQAARFHFTADRLAYLSAHSLLRLTLSEQVPEVMPRQWRFRVDSHGKPSLIASPEQPRWFTSLSHTRGHVAVAICAHSEIGVDIEKRAHPALSPENLRTILSNTEITALRRLPAERHTHRLAQMWTLKEAVSKVIGMGLAYPLHTLSIDLDRLRITTADNALRHHDWQLFHQDLPDYSVAGACRYQAGGATRGFRLHEVEPARLMKSAYPLPGRRHMETPHA
ncbi:4'-phosphopantetheinyl transferase family protein [Solilutibacter pythonis]|nr:4'-phosphopantetheinyl transferase superfamily protein [Lysobacter pythonis]